LVLQLGLKVRFCASFDKWVPEGMALSEEIDADSTFDLIATLTLKEELIEGDFSKFPHVEYVLYRMVPPGR
jgi:hypothetical protein